MSTEITKEKVEEALFNLEVHAGFDIEKIDEETFQVKGRSFNGQSFKFIPQTIDAKKLIEMFEEEFY